MISNTYKSSKPDIKLLTPVQLRNQIKDRVKNYLGWMRENTKLRIPEDQQILSPKYDFVFKDNFRYLNFHPGIMQQAQDMLAGRIDRYYHDASSEISIHDYVGHIASSQALCWNIVLPMKKHDNFGPLFEALSSAMERQGSASDFDFGLETTEVLELNVGQDLGEDSKAATSIDLYLRTPKGKVCAVEFKLTEPDFGRCKLPRARNGKCDGNYGSLRNIENNDGYLCYLAMKGRRYWHLGGQYNLLNPTQKIGAANPNPDGRFWCFPIWMSSSSPPIRLSHLRPSLPGTVSPQNKSPALGRGMKILLITRIRIRLIVANHLLTLPALPLLPIPDKFLQFRLVHRSDYFLSRHPWRDQILDMLN